MWDKATPKWNLKRLDHIVYVMVTAEFATKNLFSFKYKLQEFQCREKKKKKKVKKKFTATWNLFASDDETISVEKKKSIQQKQQQQQQQNMRNVNYGGVWCIIER